MAEGRWRAETAAQTQAFAAELARIGAPLAAEAGIFVGLRGDLGAGKTTFVQGLVGALPGGRDLYVTSPTYALVQPYPTAPPVTHMDLYRLGSLDELELIGYRDHYFGPGFTLVEWVDRVPEAVPREWMDIELAVTADDAREIRVRAQGERLERMLREVRT